LNPLFLGYDAADRPIRLGGKDREAHMHVIGSSGSGKSKFLEWMIRGDLANRQGFCLIDPHGTLFRDVVSYCAHRVLDREIILLDLSNPTYVIPFNPFRRARRTDISVQVDRRITATMHAWGASNTDETPTLERTLRLIYTTLIEQGLSFLDAQYLIDFNSRDIRTPLIRNTSSPLIRREWEELQQLKPKDWRAEVLSAKNRLFRLLTSTNLVRFFSPSANALDIGDIIDNGKILLVNLAPSDQLSEENARVFGALLVNELFEAARRRTAEQPKPFYLYVDEFQTFVSLDITNMLDQVRKFGLYCVLAHQRFGQLDEDLVDAALNNCQIKAVFGGLSVENARAMAYELFIGELDPKKIKVAIYQTKFWPTYSRDTVHTHSWSEGHSSGRGENYASSSSSSAASGEYFQGSDWFASGYSDVSTRGQSDVRGHHSSETDFVGEMGGTADIPILLPVPFKELSNIQFYTPEEQVLELTAGLKEQFPRHCFIKIHQHKTQPMLVPFVKKFYMPPENLTRYNERLLARAGACPAAEIDNLVLQKSGNEKVTKQRKGETPKGPTWTDLVGKE